MSSCMSAWPWRPTPMQPNWRVSLGAGRANTDDGTMAGATAVAAAALRKLLRFMGASPAELYNARLSPVNAMK